MSCLKGFKGTRVLHAEYLIACRKIADGMLNGFTNESKADLIYERNCLFSLYNEAMAWKAWRNFEGWVKDDFNTPFGFFEVI